MRRLGYIVLLSSLTVTVMMFAVFVGEGIDAYYRSRMVDMVHGTAYRPYVSRVLVPGLARMGSAALPLRIRDTLTRAFDACPWRPTGWPPAYATEYVLVLLIMSASLTGYATAIGDLFNAVLAAPALAVSSTALISLACVPVFLGPFSRQIYDFTTLWLFTLALALMARSRWTAFALLFPFACLNKETSILLTLVFAVHASRDRDRLSSTGFRRLLAYQLSAFVVVRASVAYAFRNNLGSSVELHLFDHNQYVLLHPLVMSKRLPLLAGATLVGVSGWQRKPALLRHALIVLAPVLLIMGVTVGQVDEIRAYYEIYPVVVLLVAESVCHALGISIGLASSRARTLVTTAHA
jgi:hypothetical protein